VTVMVSAAASVESVSIVTKSQRVCRAHLIRVMPPFAPDVIALGCLVSAAGVHSTESARRPGYAEADQQHGSRLRDRICVGKLVAN
jgi:hypothetical protein